MPRAAQYSKKCLIRLNFARHVDVEVRGPSRNEAIWRGVTLPSGISPTWCAKDLRFRPEISYRKPKDRLRSTYVRMLSNNVTANPSNQRQRRSAETSCRASRKFRRIWSRGGPRNRQFPLTKSPGLASGSRRRGEAREVLCVKK